MKVLTMRPITKRYSTQDERQSMADCYIRGESARNAAARFGFSQMVCLDELRRREIPIRKKTPKLGEEFQRRVVDAYIGGDSLALIAAKYGCNDETCRQILIRHKIKRRPRATYTLNHSFFDRVDTEDKAYWLGFLTADGCLQKNKKLTLSLSAKDRTHLVKFLKAVSGNHPITEEFHHCKFPIVRVSLFSSRIVDALKRLGLCERKSLIVEPCAQIPSDLERHYWRGCIDGDGSVNEYKYRQSGKLCNDIRVSYCGTYTMVRGLISFLESRLQKIITQGRKPKRCGNVYGIIYGGGPGPCSILRLLYKDTVVYLDRKKQIATNILDRRSS